MTRSVFKLDGPTEKLVQEIELYLQERQVGFEVDENNSIALLIGGTRYSLVDIDHNFGPVRNFPRLIESERIAVTE